MSRAFRSWAIAIASASPFPRSVASASNANVADETTRAQGSAATFGTSCPAARPAVSSSTTLAGTSTSAYSAGGKSMLPSWWRYNNGDVLLTTSRICQVVREVGLGLLKGQDSELAESREKCNARDASELCGSI